MTKRNRTSGGNYAPSNNSMQRAAFAPPLMYVAVVAIILGQSFLLGSVLLFGYGLVVWLACHTFVLVYEEPTLHKQFGEPYRVYKSRVGRWWPRLRPWRGVDVA